MVLANVTGVRGQCLTVCRQVDNLALVSGQVAGQVHADTVISTGLCLHGSFCLSSPFKMSIIVYLQVLETVTVKNDTEKNITEVSNVRDTDLNTY